MMLGWPAHTYPELLAPNSTIPITYDETAMIAGMLLTGFVVATPLTSLQSLNNKYCSIFGSLIIVTGWLTLYYATNVLMLCLSRLCVGIGTGFGKGKFLFYTQEFFNTNFNARITKGLVVFIGVGAFFSYVAGIYLSFYNFSLMAMFIPAVAFISFLLCPSSPRSLVRRNNQMEAEEILKMVHGRDDNNIQDYMDNLEKMDEKESWNIFRIFKNSKTRKDLGLLTFIMTIQQCTGGPSYIVYCQIIFTSLGYGDSSPYYSILYIILFTLSTLLGLSFIHKYPRKIVLLLSLLGVSLTNTANMLFLYFGPQIQYFAFVPLIFMLLFVCFHTIGLTVVPLLLVNDLFEEPCRFTMNCYVKMYTFELAVIITKVFQVLFTYYDMSIAFGLFSAVAVFGLLVILCFFKETKDEKQ